MKKKHSPLNPDWCKPNFEMHQEWPGVSVSPKLVATLSSHRSIRNPSIMKLLNVSTLFGILLKCVVASEDVVGAGFREAVDGNNLEWLRDNRGGWIDRKDLLDYVIARGADITVKFIQKNWNTKERMLAALFVKGKKAVIDGVFERIEYEDDDLRDLLDYRPELAGSPARFFRILEKIKAPWKQRRAIYFGVKSLLAAKKYDSIVSLVNASGRRTLNGEI